VTTGSKENLNQANNKKDGKGVTNKFELADQVRAPAFVILLR
jgi:hypothetical protein